MQSGYVLCASNNKQVLCISGDKTGVELVDIKETNSLNRALCMPDLTSIKDLYERFKAHELVGELDIVNIAKLYKHSF
tara:strand:+ start:163 stop:396 length:234 start_codon:yes stop_codon:yes gene_type:complete